MIIQLALKTEPKWEALVEEIKDNRQLGRVAI